MQKPIDDSSSAAIQEDDIGTAVLLTVENDAGMTVHCFDAVTPDPEVKPEKPE